MPPGTPGTCHRRERAWGFFRLVSPAEGVGLSAWTAEVPQFPFGELRWGFFEAACTGTRSGSCPQGHIPHNKVQDRGAVSTEIRHQHCVRTHLPLPPLLPHPPPPHPTPTTSVDILAQKKLPPGRFASDAAKATIARALSSVSDASRCFQDLCSALRAAACAACFAVSTLYDQVLVCRSAAAAWFSIPGLSSLLRRLVECWVCLLERSFYFAVLMTALPGKKVKIPSSQEKDSSSSLKVEQGRFSQVWLCGAALAAAAAASTGFECVLSGVATAAAWLSFALLAFLWHLTFSSMGESEVDKSVDACLCQDGVDTDVWPRVAPSVQA